ncbi:MAG: PAS domain-containing protein [Negativicutes bacterium]|nr:PAS domain-containing protein [Negativicutes bacterium]
MKSGLVGQRICSLVRTHPRHFLLCFVLLLAFWLFAYVMASREYQETVRNIEQNNDQLVRAYEEHVRRSLHAVEEQMLLIKAEYERAGVSPAVRTMIRRATANPLITQILVLNPAGEIITSVVPGKPGVNYRDRSFFATHIATDTQATFISEPLNGRNTNKISVYLSRRLNAVGGSFAGVVAIAVESAYFSGYYHTMGFQPGQSLRIVGLDGIIRASWFDGHSEVGVDLRQTDFWNKYCKQNACGNFLARDKVFGTPRFVSYRTMPDYPLVVQVGIVADTALAEYRTRRNLYIGAALVCSILTILLTGLSLINAIWQRRKDERWKLVVEGVNDGIWDWDARTGRVYSSDRFKEILGFKQGEIGDSRDEWVSRCHPGDLDRVLQAIDAHKAGLTPHYNEIHRFRCKDGAYKWVRSRGKVMLDESGNVMRMIGALTDMDAEKKAADALMQSEQALCESQEKYKTVLEQAFDAVALIDPTTGEFVEVNRRFTEWFGFSLPGDAPLYRSHILFDEETQRTHDWLLLKQGYLPVERRMFRHKNGSLLFMERSAVIINHQDQTLIVVNYRNIAAQLQQEKAQQQDAAIARRIQRAQLSSLPPSSYVGVTTAFESLTEISGDLYHLVWLNDGQLLRGYLVDVPGHGLTTALYTSTLKVLLHEVAEKDASLAEQMSWLNQQVCRHFETDAFAAVIAFEVDLQIRQLRYVGAGVTRFWADMSARQGVVEVPGLYLGIYEGQQYLLQSLPLAVGDRVCFATDGLESAALERAGCSVETCGQICELISQGDAGIKGKDDIAIVCIDVKVLPHPLISEHWPKQLKLSGFDDYRRLKEEVGKVIAEVTGSPHSLQEVAVNEAIANALECRDGKARSQKAGIKFNRFGDRFVVRVKTSRIGFAGNAMLRRLRANPENLFSFGEDASMGRGIPMMLSMAHWMTYNHDGTELLLAWKIKK